MCYAVCLFVAKQSAGAGDSWGWAHLGIAMVEMGTGLKGSKRPLWVRAPVRAAFTSLAPQPRFAGCPKINGVPKVEVVLLPKAPNSRAPVPLFRDLGDVMILEGRRGGASCPEADSLPAG